PPTHPPNQLTTHLTTAQQTNNSWLCVGLDPVVERLPQSVLASDDPLLTFGRAIVEATADLVCAYKPNLGFWLAEGPTGLRALQSLIAEIPDHLPVILDGKFNDVGHTAAAYARAAFEMLGVDAVTANPYLGLDALRPFLAGEEHGVFLLARTSNPSAPDLQNLLVRWPERAGDGNSHPSPPPRGEGNSPASPVYGGALYEEVARLAGRWDAEYPGTCGLVVGATYPDELACLRKIAPDLPFLIPGVGAQGGSLEAAVTYGPTAGGLGPVINSSRSIIYASQGPDFAEAARVAARTLRDRINQLREHSQ
ncbi:MAG: orotidine-5'-phosphate decarboxylase, partial [Chloroflexota bacterium]|nr:orotidine-5'-phosphate decarboxylase [Chloroflexota bacterium]